MCIYVCGPHDELTMPEDVLQADELEPAFRLDLPHLASLRLKCMYVCWCGCMYAVHACIYALMLACMHACMHAYACIPKYTYI